ncbi:DUF3278 domain-containing protein [Lentilactobacillus parakefiri]|uniref:DUF3278 domain-containing protein n=1 Tax=Lentilactobacillus parakefiri TaxID=152332 RepID=A0A269XYV0_9LACO|nr:DUF3278 domain-containing protein [Lentilactobacillus parakefiri]PAK78487.1 hypothetical protein B8W98_10065 [Lentilactobacillus parakefiri]
MKESVLIKVMRYLFSIRGVLNEHNAREVGKVAINAFMFLWMYTLIANGTVLMLPENMKTRSMINGFVLINMIIGLGGVSLYVTHKVSALKLNYQEVSTEAYPKAVHKAVIHGAWFGCCYGVIAYLMLAQINGFLSIFSIGVGLFLVVVGWTSDTQREIGHIVKVE